MARPSWSLFVDWDNDGSFATAGDDISADLLDVTCERGRERPTTLPGLGFSPAGTLTATLDNTAGDYSPFNATGAHYGKIKPRRPVQLRATHNAITYTLWTGYLDRIVPAAAQGGVPTATLEASGRIVALVGASVAGALALTAATSDTVIDAILDAAGASAARSLETGATTIAVWYPRGDADALTEIRAVEVAELGLFFEAADGTYTFHNRNHRNTATRSTTSQATFSDAAGTLSYVSVTEEDPLEQIVNAVTATVTPYSTLALAVLWTYAGDELQLGPGQSLTITATAANDVAYVQTWTTPVVGSDILHSGGPDADLSVSVVKSAREMTITIQNGSATNTHTFSLVQARGTAVLTGDATSVTVEDAASQADYDTRPLTIPTNWLPNLSTAQSFAEYILDQYADPVPVLSIEVPASHSDAFTVEALTREIGDRVTVVATGSRTRLGISTDFYVEKITHRVVREGRAHMAVYGLSPAPTAAGGYWTVGTSQLGTGTRLGF